MSINHELTIGRVWRWFVGELSECYGRREASAIGREVFFRFFNITPDQRVVRAGDSLERDHLARLESALTALKKGIPVQYITGVVSFLDLDIEVRPGVLIPRPETQELVLWVVSTLENTYGNSPINILDVGTGSGCIAISLAKRLEYAQVQACDISVAALEVARRNALNNSLDMRFFFCDILEVSQRLALSDDADSGDEPVKVFEDNDSDANKTKRFAYKGGMSDMFECVISNPPYVRQSEKIHMKPNVLTHEPGLALFVDDKDPLTYYRAVGRMAIHCLQPGGVLFFEINEAFGEETATLMEEIGFMHVRLKQDIHGKDRFVMGRKKS